MKNKEYSRSTDIRNAAELYDNLSTSDKALIDAMMNMCFALLQNIQRFQNSTGKQTKETAQSGGEIMDNITVNNCTVEIRQYIVF